MCSLTTECVLLLEDGTHKWISRMWNRMCSLTTECVLLQEDGTHKWISDGDGVDVVNPEPWQADVNNLY